MTIFLNFKLDSFLNGENCFSIFTVCTQGSFQTDSAVFPSYFTYYSITLIFLLSSSEYRSEYLFFELSLSTATQIPRGYEISDFRKLEGKVGI